MGSNLLVLISDFFVGQIILVKYVAAAINIAKNLWH